MASVIVNDKGLLYGGFFEGRPVWYRTKRDACVLNEEVATAAERQLKNLEFKVCKLDANSVARKWVPKDLAATMDFT